MKNQKLQILAFLIFSIYTLIGCQNEKNADEVLAKAKTLLKENKTIHYHFKTFWDNRFNETTFSSTASIVYTQLDTGVHKIAFYAKGEDYELLFDGKDYTEIRHKKQKIIQYDPYKIAVDSNYFSDDMLLSMLPSKFLKNEDFSNKRDSIIGDNKYFILKKEEHTTSQENKPLVYETHLFINANTTLLDQVRKITIIDRDTAQIINTRFNAYKLESEAYTYNLSSIENPALNKYQTMSYEAAENEREQKIIDIGAKVQQNAYHDLNDELVKLYGESNKQTMLMFSFIGCGGCEYAMREMKASAYKINPNIKLYYSSPQNEKGPLKRYLDKKGFPFQAFSKESNMNMEFGVYSFPTFVLIDSKGMVKDVFEFYDENVEAVLFD